MAGKVNPSQIAQVQARGGRRFLVATHSKESDKALLDRVNAVRVVKRVNTNSAPSKAAAASSRAARGNPPDAGVYEILLEVNEGDGWEVYNRWIAANAAEMKELKREAGAEKDKLKRYSPSVKSRIRVIRANPGFVRRVLAGRRAEAARKRLEASLAKVRAEIVELEQGIVEFRHGSVWQGEPGRASRLARKWAAQDSLRKQRLQKIETQLFKELRSLPKANPARPNVRNLDSRRLNPPTTEMSQRFLGAADGHVVKMCGAKGMPGNVSRAGRLVFLGLASGKRLRIPGASVVIDPRLERLWIAGDRTPLLNRKAKPGTRLDYGEIDTICYEVAKKHIGNGKIFEYVHSFGEDGGRKPRLHVDAEGMPLLIGGDYKIRREGIVD